MFKTMEYWTTASSLSIPHGPPLRCGSASGIVVNVQGRSGMGTSWVDIYSLELTGVNGDLTVWSTPGGWAGKLDKANEWVRHYKQVHYKPVHTDSRGSTVRVSLNLETPIRVGAGETTGLYVHTTGWGGMVVRGPSRGTPPTCSSTVPCVCPPPGLPFSHRHLVVSSGCSKTWSPAPFGEVRQWALLRQLNAILVYRVQWCPWTLSGHPLFPLPHRQAAEGVRVALCCGSKGLPRIAAELILEFCHAEWFV